MSSTLSEVERDLLTWVLPASRVAYAPYRECVAQWVVASRGQRGEGHVVFAPEGKAVDLDAPLPHVFAFGVSQTSAGDIAVTVRELVMEQLDCDISNLAGGSIPARFEEIRRWSFSEWDPGMPCPICSQRVREVRITADDTVSCILVICSADRRLWVFDPVREVALPVPLTRFYAELMRTRGIRDPKVALDPQLFYAMLPSLTDDQLREAFIQYNVLRPRIFIEETRRPGPARGRSILGFVRHVFRKTSS